MRVAARPRSIDDHYRTFARRMLADATPGISHGPWRGIRSPSDAIIRGMPHAQTHTRPTGLAVWLIIAGVIGAWTFVGRQQAADRASRAAAAARPVRIAVALFDNETKRPDYDQLAQTLTDAIVARLANDPSRLTVVGNAPILRQVRSFRSGRRLADCTVVRAAVVFRVAADLRSARWRCRVFALLARAMVSDRRARCRFAYHRAHRP